MVFADSSGFIAAFDARDADHAEAARAWRAIATSKEAVVTTALVLAETVTHLRRRSGWEPSRKIGNAILASRGVDVVCPTREQLDAAWRDFLRDADPKLSLCDSLSFVVMRERRIARALTFDQHFVAAGFSIMPA
jgi:predicted nucleic acid-binding protein